MKALLKTDNLGECHYIKVLNYPVHLHFVHLQILKVNRKYELFLNKSNITFAIFISPSSYNSHDNINSITV